MGGGTAQRSDQWTSARSMERGEEERWLKDHSGGIRRGQSRATARRGAPLQPSQSSMIAMRCAYDRCVLSRPLFPVDHWAVAAACHRIALRAGRQRVRIRCDSRADCIPVCRLLLSLCSTPSLLLALPPSLAPHPAPPRSLARVCPRSRPARL